MYLLADRVGDARACPDRAATLAREWGEHGYEVYARRLLGEVAAFAGTAGVPEAKARYREALTAAEELGMRPLAAHCHLGLGKLDRRTGKREHITTATTMYREMGMTYWLEQTEAEMRELA